MKELLTEKNNPKRAGQQASGHYLFGSFHRYRVFAVHTMFDNIQWFVTDAERIDDLGFPAVIRQDDDFYKAISGLQSTD